MSKRAEDEKGKPARAIFQYCWRGKMVPIMVYVGDKVLLDTERQRTDEGWSRDAAQFEFDGDTVTVECFSEGRDCDGYMSTLDRLACELGDLTAHSYTDEHGVEMHAPLWKRMESAVCDEAAERAGY